MMDTSRIIAYLEGRMNDSEVRAFENEMNSDPELKELVEEYIILNNISNASLELDLLDEVKSVSSKTKLRKDSSQRFSPGWIIAIIAAVLLLGYLVYSLMNNNTPQQDPMLYAEKQYEEPYWPIQRGSTGSLLSTAIVAGQNGNMDVARSYLLDSLSNEKTGKYWLAELYYYNANYQSVLEALPYFESEHNLYNRGQLLRTLSLLKLDRTSEALEMMKNSNDPRLKEMLKDFQ